MSRSILITPRSLTQDPPPELQLLAQAGFDLIYSQPGQTPTETELLDLVKDCVGWLAGAEPISEKVLAAATALKVISRNGTGVDNIPVEVAERRGIRILRAEGANARGVAELAICLALASLRHLPAQHVSLSSGEWKIWRGREIENRELIVIGCGAVGRIVIRLAQGLGAKTAAFDAYPDQTFQPGGSFRWVTFEEAVAQADLLSLHCPATPDGSPLIDQRVLDRVKPDCCLINTARGTLVDEQAIISALDAGQLSVYATDVFRTEPPPQDSPLLRHQRVIATPHVAAFTEESINRASRKAIENLLGFFAGT